MRKSTRLILILALALLLSMPAMASEREVVWGDVCSLNQTDFGMDETCTGVMITEVPTSQMGKVMLGSRQIQSGDALLVSDLDALTFIPGGSLVGDAVISCIQLTDNGIGDTAEATIKIGSGENTAPIAEDSNFTTYKNISGQVELAVSDPEGDTLMVTIVKEPKRGTLEIAEDGTITYTPKENKVGKDSFTYYVTDPSGNSSEEATVRIEIKKPEHKETYGDMTDDSGLLAATWLREEDIFTAETVNGQLLFQPDKTVTRGEFIAMCAALTGKTEAAQDITVNFADEVPVWLSDAVSTAVQCGYLSGIPTENGLMLSADAPITQSEAAVMVQHLLSLPAAQTQTVMAVEESIPTWASDAVSSVQAAGVFSVTDASAGLTRRDAAQLLYKVSQMGEESENTLLSWAKD